MPYIIHRSQAGFIKGCLWTDNIILANEILYEINRHKNKAFFFGKFDVKKAFNIVNKEFLYIMMHQKGFSPLFIDCIKACTSNNHYYVCINSNLESFSNSFFGLRQGCTLFPYIFCIIMDVLSNLLDNSNN